MDGFYERLSVAAATIDELLSDAFETLPGQKGDAETAARRLAAWCRSSASGDWALFERRLQRDGLGLRQVLGRFATVRRRAAASRPGWIDDAIWLEAALQGTSPAALRSAASADAEPCAFEQLLAPVGLEAESRLRAAVDPRALDRLDESARACLRRSLLQKLSSIAAPAIYQRFDKMRKAAAAAEPGEARLGAPAPHYERFVAEMQAGGFRQMFEDKPVLLRLLALAVRQWIETTRAFILRLHADLKIIRRDLVGSDKTTRVVAIEGGLSDPHNGGDSVQIVAFADGSRVVYKPKDLRLDAAWCDLIERLNRADAPIELKAMRAIAGDRYGWTEFIAHTACRDQQELTRYFRRAGAWLALFHGFAATDMHQENMIAVGDHPVPIDLEMLLQAAAETGKSPDPEGQALEAARNVIANSVMTVGLLPAYARSPDNSLFAVGGLTSGRHSETKLTWNNINSDEMRPVKSSTLGATQPNLPHLDGRYARFADHIDEFIAGFAEYARFLVRRRTESGAGWLLDGFAGLPVRRVIRPTAFYDMLLQRLKDHRTMHDAVIWSAQADFTARLADWRSESDPLWPLQRAERAALGTLNVPHFVSPSDTDEIADASGVAIRTGAVSGLDRARARMASLDEPQIAWQVEVIRQITNSIAPRDRPAAPPPQSRAPRAGADAAPERIFIAEAGRIAAEISRDAIRHGPGAAWIGLDWLGDSEVSQLVCLGPDLYNGVPGIAVFLAAHAAVAGSEASRELALAGMAQLRKSLNGGNAARTARTLGIGGATGLGSIVYALAVMGQCLGDQSLAADAVAAAELFTDDLIAADKRLDVIGGSAGAILALLRLHRDTGDAEVLRRAMTCGEHLMRQRRVGAEGCRSWVGQGSGAHALNGMSHGAAGFAYALSALSAATGREDFARAAAECVAFENASYDALRNNWPDLRIANEPRWPCQWCYGASGIGLARIAMRKRAGMDAEHLAVDIRNAVAGVTGSSPGSVDTLCCGTLGNIEFLCEADNVLESGEIRALAAQRLLAVVQTAAANGDYRWNSGKGPFNLGLFRGLAGVGYTLLRRLDASLPNVMIWE